MKVSTEALHELAANMLGVDEDDETTSGQQYDALKETLNVICGNLIPAIAGGLEIFDIDPPEILTDGDTLEKGSDHKLMSKVKLMLEDGQCDLFLFTDERFSLNRYAAERQ